MLRTKAVEAGTLDLIKRFMSDDRFNGFNLVGGTALALKVGHRKSIDIDLFSTSAFSAPGLAGHLEANYQAQVFKIMDNGVFCFVDNIKVDLIAHQYPLIERLETVDGIRIVSLLDIGAMKLNAMFNSGKRLKDFVDMYFLLEIYSLNQLLQACQRKYPDLNMTLVKQSIIRHNEIISLPIEFVGLGIERAVMAERLNGAFQNPNITFNLPDSVKKLAGQKAKKGKTTKRGRRL
jgi:hypothetical protein